MMIHITSFHYVGDGGEVQETPFQAFEVVSVEMVPLVKKTKNDEFPMVSWKDVRIVIKAGGLECWNYQ